MAVTTQAQILVWTVEAFVRSVGARWRVCKSALAGKQFQWHRGPVRAVRPHQWPRPCAITATAPTSNLSLAGLLRDGAPPCTLQFEILEHTFKLGVHIV